MSEPPILSVTGGVGGTSMRYAIAQHLATSYDVAGSRMRTWAATGGMAMVDEEVVQSAVLSPLTFAEAEGAVLRATTGSDGILVESVGWEADAVAIRATVGALEAADAAVRGMFEAVDYGAGALVGSLAVVGTAAATPTLLTAAVLLGPRAANAWQSLPAPLRAELRERAAREAAAGADKLGDWLADHPEVLQHLVNGSGGLLDGLGAWTSGELHPTTESAAGALASAYTDGRAEVHSRPDLAVGSATSPPADLAGLIRHLEETNDLSPIGTPGAEGTIEVQTITDDSGTRHIVYLPGTDDLTTLPWTQDGDVRDAGTNFLLVADADNSYQSGILTAMRQAGIEPGEPVLLAAHSQGGMAAARILAQGSDFTISQVVTAGSPTAQLPGFPLGSRVLSLENAGDVVPLLDGEPNPDSAEQVTVRFDAPGASLGDNHDLSRYAAGAAAVDAADDPSLVAMLQGMRRVGFLGTQPDAEVTSQVFQVVRVSP